VHTGPQGQEEQHPRDTRALAAPRSQAQRASLGAACRLWDGWGLRLPLGANPAMTSGIFRAFGDASFRVTKGI
jgi:hypothetical protein